MPPNKTVDEQLAKLFDTIGEPIEGGRFTKPQALIALNDGREWVAEETHSFQVTDSQTTIVGQKRYTLRNDIIEFFTLEWGGHTVTPVRPRNWRDEIGDDDTIIGTPVIAKQWARQIQLFPVPDRALLLSLEGPAYPVELLLGGVDPDYFKRQQDCAIWRAAWVLKAVDERDTKHEEAEALKLAAKLEDQYRRKGRRSVNTGSIDTHGLAL